MVRWVRQGWKIPELAITSDEKTLKGCHKAFHSNSVLNRKDTCFGYGVIGSWITTVESTDQTNIAAVRPAQLVPCYITMSFLLLAVCGTQSQTFQLGEDCTTPLFGIIQYILRLPCCAKTNLT